MAMTLWPLEEHTKGKHMVLRRYLEAWLPIMGTWNGRILFIDGFAGPGEYDRGEEGSPIIALRALVEHQAQRSIRGDIHFAFIEKEPARAEHLASLVEGWRSKLPPGSTVTVVHGLFDETMTGLLDQLEDRRRSLAPSFVMIDPFGVSGTPMSVIQRILAHTRSEVYVSFMYESINRFGVTPEFRDHLDGLFGCAEWIDGIGIADGRERRDFFYGLYESQLRKAGAEQVVHFDLYEGNRLVYAIFFGTKHHTGSDRMKQAIWKVAPFGNFAFRGTKSPQLTLGIDEPDYEPLKEALKQRFKGERWWTVDEIQNFVASDATEYHIGQLRRHALIPMETNGELEVDENTRRKQRTYPAGTMIRFI